MGRERERDAMKVVLEAIGFGAVCSSLAYVGAALTGWDCTRAAVVAASATTAMWLVRTYTRTR